MRRIKHGVPATARALVFLLAFIGAALSALESDKAEAAAGEKMVFRVSWSFVPAGEVVMEEMASGDQRRHFVLTAATYPFLDLLYKIRDRIESFTDVKVSQSFGYSKKQDGRSKRDISLTFDWQKGEVQYRNFAEVMAPIPVEPGTLDPLSAFYHLRQLDFSGNEKITNLVTDGKKVVLGEVAVLGREIVATPAGSFDAWLVEPETRDLGGVFEKSRNAKLLLWISADERRILVKARSKVLIGSFELELIDYQPGGLPDGA